MSITGRPIPTACLAIASCRALFTDEALQGLISFDEIKKVLAEQFLDEFELEDTRRYVEEGFEEDETLPWRRALKNKLNTIQKEHAAALKKAVREAVIEALKDGQS